MDEKEYDIIGFHQCPVPFCTGIIASSPVRDLSTELLVSQLQLVEGKEITETPTPPNFFDKYFILEAYLESCAKPPAISQ